MSEKEKERKRKTGNSINMVDVKHNVNPVLKAAVRLNSLSKLTPYCKRLNNIFLCIGYRKRGACQIEALYYFFKLILGSCQLSN